MTILSRLQQAWRVVRGYAAAQDSRMSAWPTGGGSANDEVGPAALTVARRARAAVRDNPYAARIVELWASNAVGAGITTRWPDDAHANAWRKWAESTACDAERTLDLYAIYTLVVRAVVESGECFVRFIPTPPTPENPLGLRLQVLESDHLDTSRNGTVDGRATIQGIALGDAGQPVGYWLFRNHPGAAWLAMPRGVWESEFVPAADVLHVYRKRRPGQLRDVSWLVPILTTLRNFEDYEVALLMKAKVEACLTLISTDDGGEDGLTGPTNAMLTDAAGRPVESIEPGMILHRRSGGAVDIVNPSGGGSHVDFARRALEAAAVGTGLTYDQVSGSLTEANFSSLRAGKIEFRRACEQVQYGMLLPMLVRPIADRFHQHGAMLALWPSDMPANVTHQPPAHEMIDPLKDTLALIAQVRAGFVPLQEAVGAFGYDFNQAVGMIREANAMLDDGGVALDTDPRRVAKSGAAQDAAQLAAIEIAATGAASAQT